ncbi:Fungalysin metallopeptidase-domain-containing protein [Mycena rebaudengoi]|nr:Fungalysin metallopeptidase-domain-containing protein [Mycena rebaudengoi]
MPTTSPYHVLVTDLPYTRSGGLAWQQEQILLLDHDSSTHYFTSVLIAVLYASSVTAAPVRSGRRHGTHNRRQLPSGLSLETYHPASTFETFGAGVDHPLRKRDGASLKDASVAYVQDKLNLPADTVAWQSGFTAANARYAYVKQSQDGIFFANAVANVAFNSEDNVVAFGSSFVTPKSVASSTPSVDLADAVAMAEKMLDGSNAGLPDSEIKYFAKEDGSAALVYSLQVKNEETGTWFEALVDAHSKEMVSVVDYVAQATYRVLPIEKKIQTEGFETLVNPEDLTASPNGWHFTGAADSTDTSGNNVISFKGTPADTTKETSAGPTFDFTEDPTVDPTEGANIDAARVNTFYLLNTVHDIASRYGFTEDAFNFQFNNLGKGGAAADPVLVSVQDASGTNNANFATPPDGQSGQMRMFLFDATVPRRDGALENDVVVHEAMHGITNRLTGGGTATCLQTLEAGGLGEGWSDALAEWTEQKSATIEDYVLGTFVSNTANIRTKPYSTDKAVNPLTYADVGINNEVHNIGEVWANMLHNVYAALVGELGFNADAATNPDGTEGNVVFMHLMIDALALQPCNPTFITARDAWLQADKNRFNGANTCTVIKAFASRGLGINAVPFVDDATVPPECQ